MLNGHGDDLHDYPDIRINFSSNVYTHFDHTSLFAHLTQMLPRVTSYPQPTPVSLEHALAVHLDLKPDEVMVTNGATEAIYLIAQTYAGSHSAILQPTFSEYEDACILHRHECHHCLDLVHATSFLSPSSIVWICNPNNPTGQVMDKSTLLHAIISHPSLIFVLDASYAPFTSQPVLSASETVHLPNVLMLHSMTKTYAVPGLRLGYLTASPLSSPASAASECRGRSISQLKMQVSTSLPTVPTTASTCRLSCGSDSEWLMRSLPCPT